MVGLFEARFPPFPNGQGGIVPETCPRLDADRGNAIEKRPREGCARAGTTNCRGPCG